MPSPRITCTRRILKIKKTAYVSIPKPARLMLDVTFGDELTIELDTKNNRLILTPTIRLLSPVEPEPEQFTLAAPAEGELATPAAATPEPAAVAAATKVA